MHDVIVRDADGVRRIFFDRPTKLNALTPSAVAAATAAVRGVPAGIRALVFRGTGGKAFSAGMDVSSFVGLDVDAARALIRGLKALFDAVRALPVPTLAVIDGYCIGAAFELALTCDLRVCVPGARFGLPEVKVGIPSVLDAGLLQHFVGLSKAREIVLTGDLYALEALASPGFANVVSAPETIDGAADALLERVSRHSSTVLAAQKRLFDLWLNEPAERAATASVEIFARVFAHEDTQDAVRRYAVRNA